MSKGAPILPQAAIERTVSGKIDLKKAPSAMEERAKAWAAKAANK